MSKLPNITTYLGLLSVGDDVLLTWSPVCVKQKNPGERRYTVSAIWEDMSRIQLSFNEDTTDGGSYSHNGDILGKISLLKIIPKSVDIDWEKRIGGRKNE